MPEESGGTVRKVLEYLEHTVRASDLQLDSQQAVRTLGNNLSLALYITEVISCPGSQLDSWLECFHPRAQELCT